MIYVSITTIPQRIKNLNKSVKSLLNQTRKPDKIFINIPFKYKRFSEAIVDNQIPKFDNNVVEITRCEDYGPGTKLLGSLNKLQKDSLLILADDDHTYEDYMIEKLQSIWNKCCSKAIGAIFLKSHDFINSSFCLDGISSISLIIKISSFENFSQAVLI